MHAKVDEALGYDSVPTAGAEHPLNRQLLAYWEKKRRSGGALLRADFEPLDLPRILPGLFIAEPVGDDFRFRLAGSDVEARMHRKVMGATLCELLGDRFAPRTIEIYRTVSLGDAPFVLRGHYLGDDLEHIDFEVLHLPMEFVSGIRGVLGGQFAFD